MAGGPGEDRVSYAELHCHSSFSFLDGCSSPEELVVAAARRGLRALALTDHDGFYGVVRFAKAAQLVGLPTVFGAELTIGLRAGGASSGNEGVGHTSGSPSRQAPGLSPRPGAADPAGQHLVVLAKDPEGYARLSRVISEAHLRGGEKGRPVLSLDDIAGASGGHWLVLTGCRKGAVASALELAGPQAASRELSLLVGRFGSENVAVELWDHGDPLDSARNDALAELALRAGVEPVATNNVHYATPSGARLANAMAAVRARRSLDEMDPWLPASAAACIRSGAEQRRRFSRWPGVVEKAAELGEACAFDLKLVAPRLPDFPVPAGHDEMSWLRELVARGAEFRYGPRSSERVPGAWTQIDHELSVISALGFPGYFLVVWDVVQFCRLKGILCQGRGSAANSAVCYALGITNVDAVGLGLLFERFLSPERDGPPDIDVDIESGRRDEVFAYVYDRYGRDRAAQVANVITYRARSALRDAGKALGHPPGALDAWSSQVDGWASIASISRPGGADGGADHDVPSEVLSLAARFEGLPRHLGIHSGGVVICDRPVIEVCPVEWGRMPGRSVLQWDKEDCALVGLVKFDLLGLGMLSALHGMLDLLKQDGQEVDLGMLPQEEEVYEMLSAGDSVGVFQVESRAQMATLPRLKPKRFYDLVVEVALIRPGPIQGGSVHPYIRRRNGTEPVTYLHPLLERSLSKTLGVPLFQEQLMQMAIDVAGFSAAEADQLRQAMGAKRSGERMDALRRRLYEGMAARGITGEVADAIWGKLAAFASFGFPESHSVSFAYLVYASAWFKLRHPAAFLGGLLNAQPMGFWPPHSLVADARRHGVEVRRAHVNASLSGASLERGEPLATLESPGTPLGGHPPLRPALRLGISSVRGLGKELGELIAANAPYASMEELVRRVRLSRLQLEALGTAGALDGLVPTSGEGPLRRREAIWAAGALAGAGPGRLSGIVTGARPPSLVPMTPMEETAADLWASGVAPSAHPVSFARKSLEARGVSRACDLARADPGARVVVAGVVTHRQRPSTAGGTVFLNLEDETGLVNVICSSGAWVRWRRVARGSSALLVSGRLERAEGVVNVVAERMSHLPWEMPTSPSRDFR